jgi:hydroxymethylbilane synthase
MSTLTNPVPQTDDSTTNPSSSSNKSHSIIRIGTRRSALARTQVDIVVEELKRRWHNSSNPTNSDPKENAYKNTEFEIHAIATNLGDVDKTSPLYQMGQEGKSIWTHELEVGLLEGSLDFVVHSLKGRLKLCAGHHPLMELR